MHSIPYGKAQSSLCIHHHHHEPWTPTVCVYLSMQVNTAWTATLYFSLHFALSTLDSCLYQNRACLRDTTSSSSSRMQSLATAVVVSSAITTLPRIAHSSTKHVLYCHTLYYINLPDRAILEIQV